MEEAGTRRVFVELLAALAKVLDIEESQKLYHAWRVALLALEMARRGEAGIAAEVFYAGLLHDIGALGLNDHIVHLVLRGDQAHNPIILGHAQRGAEIVREIPGLEAAARFVLEHHERWDGCGYPGRRRGEEISTGGQLLALADQFDVLLRVHPLEEVVRTVRARTGSVFSERAFAAFEMALAGEDFERLLANDGLEGLMQQTLQSIPAPVFQQADWLEATVRVFARIIDAKHAYTAGHSQRVAEYAVSIAKALGQPEDTLRQLRTAALLHDIGKLAVPRHILDKPARLAPPEFAVVKLHPLYTLELLSAISGLRQVAPWAAYHHERFDGGGYPHGLRGEDIPLQARIISLADAFDAMTSARPYQQMRDPAGALEVLQAYAGKQFDPRLVPVAVRVLGRAG